MKKQKTNIRKNDKFQKILVVFLVGAIELESTTSCMSSKHSNQLSYVPKDLNILTYFPLIYKQFKQ